MLWFIVLSAVAVMLIILGIHEGWKRSLKIFAVFFSAMVGIFVLGSAFQWNVYAIGLVIKISWGVFLFWLIIHNMLNGYIGKF